MAKQATKKNQTLLYIILAIVAAALIGFGVWYVMAPDADAPPPIAKGSLADAKQQCKALITKSLHNGKAAKFDDESTFSVIKDLYKTPEENDVYIGVNAQGGRGNWMYMKLTCRVRKAADGGWQVLRVAPDETPQGNAQ